MTDKVVELETRLTGVKGGERLNEVASLFELAESEDLQVVADALQAIPRVLLHHRRRCRDSSGSPELLAWLGQHFEAYHSALAQLAASPKPRAQACGVRLAMVTIQDEVQAAETGTPTPQSRVQNLLTEILLTGKWTGHSGKCLMEEYASSHADIKHYTLHSLRAMLEQVGKAGAGASAAGASVAKKLKTNDGKAASAAVPPFVAEMAERGVSSDELFARALVLLREAPPPSAAEAAAPSAEGGGGAEAEDAGLWASNGRPASFFKREYKKLFQAAWLQLLSLRAPFDQCRPLLQLVPALVMPHMSQPLMLADFYLRAFSSGSTEVAVMSLSGLFLLLTRHGLGDPDAVSSSSGEYFARLYSLLTVETFALRQRVRFQRLLATSLNSGLLPARFAAVFAKKCMRLAASVAGEAGTSMWLISVAYSLLQKHHSHCKALLHRTTAMSEEVAPELDDAAKSDAAKAEVAKGEGASRWVDPFDMAAPLAEALDQVGRSSLWEVQLLRRHQVPAVATLTGLFLKPFFKPSARKLDPEDFLGQSAGELYTQALRSSARQRERWASKGTKCPMAFKVESDELDVRLAGWAASLSTSQRKVGANV